nr:protein dimerization [Ipomoea batatas]
MPRDSSMTTNFGRTVERVRSAIRALPESDERSFVEGSQQWGLVYELMTRAKESIRTYYIMDEIKCKTFLDIVDKKWQNKLHSPLHSAAAFLNPSIQRDITNQIRLFTRASGMFGCNLAKGSNRYGSSWIWWEQYGRCCSCTAASRHQNTEPGMQQFPFERDWSMFQQIPLGEKRNKIDKETLNDTVYINYNLKLARSSTPKSTDTDPLQLDDIDMTSEWVEEAENPSPTQWLDRFGSALDGNDLNTRQFGAAIFGAGDPIFGL